jgi:glycine/D-amino acid oxidase-like deaminating enzyme
MVTGIEHQREKVTGVNTNEGFIPCGKVVMATGPWSKYLLSAMHIEIPSIVARIKVGIYKKPQEFKRNKIWGDFISKIYLRPETGGLLLVGSISPEEETHDTVPDPDNFNQKVEFDILASFAERVAMRYPIMDSGHLFNNYASLYDITPDWHHIMDQVPGVEGLYVCAGTSGHGFKLAPSVGEMMARLVLYGKSEQDPINIFSFERFTTGNLIRSSYEYSILG